MTFDMSKSKEPDMSLEQSVLDSLELEGDQQEGAIKFLESLRLFKEIEVIGEDGEEFSKMPDRRNSPMSDTHLKSLMTTMEEYMNSYIIMGYDIGGNRVSCYNFPTEMSADASITSAISMVEVCREMVDEGILISYEKTDE